MPLNHNSADQQTFHCCRELVHDQTTFGKTIISVQVDRVRNVVNLASTLGFCARMMQRIIVPNPNNYVTGASRASAYRNYPVLLTNEVTIAADGGKIIAKDIFPRTLNAAVSTSSDSSSVETNSGSVVNTSGSSSSTVNTFGIGMAAGMMGGGPFVSGSRDYSHSRENSRFESTSIENSFVNTSSSHLSASMSIKDWSSYGLLDKATMTSPKWIWGQTFPWDVIRYNQSTGDPDRNGAPIALPRFVQDRLRSQNSRGRNVAMPPSELSLFGIDFAMTAEWLIEYPGDYAGDPQLELAFKTHRFLAEHEADADMGVAARLQTATQAASADYAIDAIDLNRFGLQPIGLHQSEPATIAFTANEFMVPPAQKRFRIVSPANNIDVEGSGFDAAMISDFSRKTELTVTFKIEDTTDNYALYMMHWIDNNSADCRLTWEVNGQHVGTLLIDTVQGNAGQNNTTKISLRDTDFSSINFHDYLRLGTNRIRITIQPLAPIKKTKYKLFAISIE